MPTTTTTTHGPIRVISNDQKRNEKMNICQNGLESQLLARVLPRLDDLKAGTPYELSEIVGDDFWAPLNDGARRGLGRTHSRLVAAGAIPLIYLGKTGENHNIYTRPA